MFLEHGWKSPALLTAALGCAFWLAGCASSRPPFEGAPDRFRAVDDVLLAAVETGQIPGAVVLVTTADRVVYRRAVGEMAPGEPMRPDALFDIASMTKPLTSLAAMMLVEEGQIDLDAPASAYLPELAGREVLVRVDTAARAVVTRPARREVTVRDLLRHTSGIGYAFSSYELLEVETYTDVPARMGPLVHDPGARWTYGMGTAQLGWIVEAVAGEPLEVFLRRRVFDPLGMDDTRFGMSAADAPRLAATYQRTSGRLAPTPRPAAIEPAPQGDGDLISTASDFVAFVQLVLGQGERAGQRLLSEEAVAEMTRDHLGALGLTVVEQPGTDSTRAAPFPLGAGHDGFGLGFQVAAGSPDGRADGSLSWAGVYNTHFWIDPQSGVGVVFLTQVLPFYDPEVIGVLRAVERAVYGVASVEEAER